VIAKALAGSVAAPLLHGIIQVKDRHPLCMALLKHPGVSGQVLLQDCTEAGKLLQHELAWLQSQDTSPQRVHALQGKNQGAWP